MGGDGVTNGGASDGVGGGEGSCKGASGGGGVTAGAVGGWLAAGGDAFSSSSSSAAAARRVPGGRMRRGEACKKRAQQQCNTRCTAYIITKSLLFIKSSGRGLSEEKSKGRICSSCMLILPEPYRRVRVALFFGVL